MSDPQEVWDDRFWLPEEDYNVKGIAVSGNRVVVVTLESCIHVYEKVPLGK